MFIGHFAVGLASKRFETVKFFSTGVGELGCQLIRSSNYHA
jgi:hypothetical protein